MPEGPECRRVTDKLRKHLKGCSLFSLELKDGLSATSKYHQVGQSWKQHMNEFPSTCLDIICKGKQIFFFFDNGICMYGGLGMEGHWYIFDTYQNSEDYSKSSKHYPKFNLEFGTICYLNSGYQINATQKFLWYDDKRNFGNFAIGTWEDAYKKMSEIGPDLLASRCPILDIDTKLANSLPESFFKPVTLDEFSIGIQNKRRKAMNICKFLMEPKYFSGIGNYLKSEILYRASMSPFLTLSELNQLQIQGLYNTILETISQAYNHGGLTHGTFLDPDMEKGTFEVYVYKKTSDENGNPVRYTKQIDGRGTYYVDSQL